MTGDKFCRENIVGFIACGPNTAKCKCQCPDGPCEHVWDGPVIGLLGYDTRLGRPYAFGRSSTCSRCGMSAFDHDLRVSP
jgi:hypothetical protein